MLRIQVLNFFTGYVVDKHTVVLSLPRIWAHYLKTFFVVDFMATFPWDLVRLPQLLAANQQ